MQPFWFSHKPVTPYAFTPHLERFTLPGQPTPWLYSSGERLCRVLLYADRVAAPVEVRIRGEPWDAVIEATIWARSRKEASLMYGRLLEALRAGFDYNRFLEALKPWPVLHSLALRHVGLRPGRSLSLYEALVDSIVKQRLALRAALRIYSRLVERYGRRLSVEGRVFYSHPRPQGLYSASVEDLRALGLSRLKARALREVAGAELEGRLPGIGEAIEDPERVVKSLTRIYGVGRWTAELAVAMVHPGFPLGPASDLAVRRGLTALLGPGAEELLAEARGSGLGSYLGLVMYLASYEYGG